MGQERAHRLDAEIHDRSPAPADDARPAAVPGKRTRVELDSELARWLARPVAPGPGRQSLVERQRMLDADPQAEQPVAQLAPVGRGPAPGSGMPPEHATPVAPQMPAGCAMPPGRAMSAEHPVAPPPLVVRALPAVQLAPLGRAAAGSGRQRLGLAQIFGHAAQGQASALPFRARMEQRFGHDLGDVRVFTGRQGLLDAAGARAATRGDTIVFGPAAPDEALVAHELAHVVQVRQAGRTGSALASAPGDAAEHEAERAAAAHGRFEIRAAPTAEIHCEWFRHPDIWWLWFDNETEEYWDERTGRRGRMDDGEIVWAPPRRDALLSAPVAIAQARAQQLLREVPALSWDDALAWLQLRHLYADGDLAALARYVRGCGLPEDRTIRLALSLPHQIWRNLVYAIVVAQSFPADVDAIAIVLGVLGSGITLANAAAVASGVGQVTPRVFACLIRLSHRFEVKVVVSLCDPLSNGVIAPDDMDALVDVLATLYSTDKLLFVIQQTIARRLPCDRVLPLVRALQAPIDAVLLCKLARRFARWDHASLVLLAACAEDTLRAAIRLGDEFDHLTVREVLDLVGLGLAAQQLEAIIRRLHQHQAPVALFLAIRRLVPVAPLGACCDLVAVAHRRRCPLEVMTPLCQSEIPVPSLALLLELFGHEHYQTAQPFLQLGPLLVGHEPARVCELVELCNFEPAEIVVTLCGLELGELLDELARLIGTGLELAALRLLLELRKHDAFADQLVAFARLVMAGRSPAIIVQAVTTVPGLTPDLLRELLAVVNAADPLCALATAAIQHKIAVEHVLLLLRESQLAADQLARLFPVSASAPYNDGQTFLALAKAIHEIGIPCELAAAVVTAVDRAADDRILLLRMVRYPAFRVVSDFVVLHEMLGQTSPAWPLELVQAIDLSQEDLARLVPLRSPAYRDAALISELLAKGIPVAALVEVIAGCGLRPQALLALLAVWQLQAYQSAKAVLGLAGFVEHGVDVARVLTLLEALQALAVDDFLELLKLATRFSANEHIVVIGRALGDIHVASRTTGDAVALALAGTAHSGLEIVELLVPSALRKTDGDSILRLTAKQVALLTAGQTAAFDVPHFQALGEQIVHLEVPAFAALPPPCILLLTDAQARRVRDVQFAVIDPRCLPGLVAVFRHFQAGCLAELTDAQALALTDQLMGALQLAQLAAILPDRFLHISGDALAGIDVDLVEHISAQQLAKIEQPKRKRLPVKYPPVVGEWLVKAETHGLPRNTQGLIAQLVLFAADAGGIEFCNQLLTVPCPLWSDAPLLKLIIRDFSSAPHHHWGLICCLVTGRKLTKTVVALYRALVAAVAGNELTVEDVVLLCTASGGLKFFEPYLQSPNIGVICRLAALLARGTKDWATCLNRLARGTQELTGNAITAQQLIAICSAGDPVALGQLLASQLVFGKLADLVPIFGLVTASHDKPVALRIARETGCLPASVLQLQVYNACPGASFDQWDWVYKKQVNGGPVAVAWLGFLVINHAQLEPAQWVLERGRLAAGDAPAVLAFITGGANPIEKLRRRNAIEHKAWHIVDATADLGVNFTLHTVQGWMTTDSSQRHVNDHPGSEPQAQWMVRNRDAGPGRGGATYTAHAVTIEGVAQTEDQILACANVHHAQLVALPNGGQLSIGAFPVVGGVLDYFYCMYNAATRLPTSATTRHPWRYTEILIVKNGPTYTVIHAQPRENPP